MKKFEEPKLNVETIDLEDIIAASSTEPTTCADDCTEYCDFDCPEFVECDFDMGGFSLK